MKIKIGKKPLIVLTVLLSSVLLSAGILAVIALTNFFATGNVLGVDWYNLRDKEFVLTTREELYEFADLSEYYDFSGQTIKLGADIAINEGDAEEWKEDAPKYKWTGIRGFAGTFDGQGHVISGLYATGYNSTIGLFTNAKTTCLVQDTKITNSYLESRGFGGASSFVTGGGGNFKKLYSDASINVIGAYSGYAGGIGSKINAISTFDECWYEGTITTTGRVTGGILDDVNGATATISHSLFSGKIHSSYDHSGAIAGGIVGKSTTEGASLIIQDCLSAGEIKTGKNNTTGSVFGAAAGGTSFRSVNSYGADTFPGIGVEGVNGSIYLLPLQVKPENMVGFNAYKWMDLDFDKYWCVVEDGAPRLQYFSDEIPSVAGIEREFDVSWYTEGGSNNVIKNTKQLRGFYILSGRTNFENTTVKLGADIVVNEGNAKDWKKTAPAEEWYQVDGFSGTFDGQGHSISGIYMNNDARYNGFFKTTRNATVKNFLLKNSIVINMLGTDLSTGSISGNASGTFENIYSDAIMELSGFLGGGLFGQVYEASTIKGCWYDGEINSLGRYSGGIIGSVTGARIKVEHCLNSGTINMTWPSGFTNSGGIVGSTYYDKGLRVQITDCLNVGRVVSEQEGLGSVLGHCVDGIVTIKDTYALDGSNELDGKSVGYNQATVNGGGVNMPKELLTGKNAYVWTTLDFDKSWSIVENGTPVPRFFAPNPPSTAGLEKAFDISWYDAKEDSFVIRTAKELLGLCIVSGQTDFTEKTVRLGADITLNTGSASNWVNRSPRNWWIPLEKFCGTFDGQGHTISGMYIKKTTRAAGMFGTTTEEAVVRNFSLKNSLLQVSGDGMLSAGSIAGIAHGTFDRIYSNALVDAKGTDFGGMFGQVYKPTNITRCWFDGRVQAREFGRYGGGVVGVVTGSSVNIAHCLNTGTIEIYANKDVPGMVNCGGILGSCYYGKDIVINITDCFNSGTLKAPYDGMGSILGHCVDGVVNIKNTYSTKESVYVAGEALDNKAIGWNQDTINGNVGKLPTDMLLGTDAYKALNLDFANYWAAVPNSTPRLKTFSGNGMSTSGVAKLYDTSWYSGSKKTFTLTTKEQLYGLSMISSYDAVPGLNYNYFKGQTIKIGKNIALNSGDAQNWLSKAPTNKWNPIMDFGGTFDGQGYTISGMYAAKDGRYSGLFGFTLQSAVVKNFSLKNSLVTNHHNAMLSTGSVAGVAHGRFEKIYSDAVVDVTGTDVGGMFGQIYENTTVSNCWFDGTVQAKEFGRYLGGVVGIVTENTANIEHCLNTGTIEILSNKDNPGMVNSGGILGSCYYKDNLVVNIKDCFNAGEIKAPYDGTGSIVGQVVNGTVNIDKCYATAESNTVDGKAIGWVNADNKAVLKGDAIQFPESVILGTNAYKLTYLDFNNYWAAVADKTPQLKSFTKNALSLEGVEQLYDKFDPEATEYVLNTKQDLYDFALMACTTDFAGKTVKLGKDIVLNEGKAADWATTAPANEWIPVQEFAGTFDGQGHTISGVYVKDDANVADNYNEAGFFKILTETAEVCNLGIINSYMKVNTFYTGSIAGISYAKRIENVYSDAIIHNSYSKEAWAGKSLGGLIGEMNTKSAGTSQVLSKAWFDGLIYYTGENQQLGGLVGNIYDEHGAKFEIYDCLFSGEINITSTEGWRDMAGIVTHLLGGGESEVYIKNCLNTGTINGSGARGIIFDFRQVKTGSISNCYAVECAAYYSDVSGVQEAGHIFAGDWFEYMEDSLTPTFVVKARGDLKFATDAKLLEKLPLHSGQTESPWMCNKFGYVADTPLLKTWATYWNSKQVRSYDVSWYVGHENDAEYILDSNEDFLGFALIAETNNFAGKTIKLGKDIVLNEGKVKDWENQAPAYVWAPIPQFSGKFDGQGHTISGVYINKLVGNSDNWEMAGFFAQLNDTAEVCNVGIVNSYIRTNTYYTGVIAGVSYAKRIENVYTDAKIHNTHSTGAWNGHSLGGFVGEMGTTASGKKHTISKAWFDGTIYYDGANQQIGGITGIVYDSKGSTFEFYDCLFSGKIEFTSTTGWRDGAGILAYSKCGTLNMANCLNTGTIIGSGCYGIGAALQNSGAGTIKNCYANDSYSTAFYDTGVNITLGDQGILTASELNFATEAAMLEKLPLLSGQEASSWMCDSTTTTPILKGFSNYWKNK